MRCERCHVNVPCKAEKCPLCHAPLRCIGEVPFPTPRPHKTRIRAFLIAYLAVAATIETVCIVLNTLYTPRILWAVPVGLSFIYVYYLVGVIAVQKRAWHKHILGQLLMLTAMFVALRLTIGMNHWLFITWLPAVFMASDLLAVGFFIKTGSQSPKYLVTLLLICLLGFIPTVSAHVFSLSVKIPSYVATGLSGAIFVTASVVHRKILLHELKKAFHF